MRFFFKAGPMSLSVFRFFCSFLEQVIPMGLIKFFLEYFHSCLHFHKDRLLRGKLLQAEVFKSQLKQSLSKITKRLSVFFLLFFSCFNFLFLAEAEEKIKRRVLSPQEELNQIKEEEFQRLSRQERKEEWKARGVIVRFHRWPSVKQKKEVARILKSSSLRKTKSIRSFRAQLFEWIEGRLKPSKEGERACVKLKSLSYVRRCRPDHLLPVNSILEQGAKKRVEIKGAGFFLGKFFLAEVGRHIRSSETEAGFTFECKNCKNQAIEQVAKVMQKALNIRTCGLLSCKKKSKGGRAACEHLNEGKLSDYWAQELIGSDLLREELEKTPTPDIENWIAVFDTKHREHNTAVKNLISDEGLHAVLPKLGERRTPVLETLLDDQGQLDDKDRGYKSSLSLYETSYPGDYFFGFKKRAPHYINNSMGWGESRDIYEVFQKLSSAKISTPIVVVASGNGFPRRLNDIEIQASKDFNIILVGSFSPRGFVSEFSQSEKEVHILAPSDYWITSAGKRWDHEPFGGTSGAAPLVTGSLAGFEWLSGYHPTAKEAKILLERTALSTLHSHEKPRINGAGLLNAYKLGEVAKRLKEKCAGQNASCFKEEILKDEHYRFSEDKSLKRDVGRLFSSCAIGEESENLLAPSSCEEKRKVFKRLRKAVLLNPSQELLESLSCIYKEGGFSQNAEGLDKLAMALRTEEEVRAELRAMALKETPLSDDSIRLMLGMGGFEKEFSSSELKRGIKVAGGIGEVALPLLEKGFTSDDEDLKAKAVDSASMMGENALPFLLEKGFASDGPEWLPMYTLNSAMQWIGEKGLPLLEKGFASGDPKLQKQALSLVVVIGEKALPLFEKAFAINSPELQKEALSKVPFLGEAAVPLLKLVLKDENLDEKIREKMNLLLSKMSTN